MTVYAIAQLDIHDRSRYERYQARFMEVFRRYQGCLLAAAEQPCVIEGTWPYRKVVLMAFADELAFRQWTEAADYQRLAQDRKAGAAATVLLVQGR